MAEWLRHAVEKHTMEGYYTEFDVKTTFIASSDTGDVCVRPEAHPACTIGLACTCVDSVERSAPYRASLMTSHGTPNPPP